MTAQETLKKDIKDLSLLELEEYLASLGEKRYRARQIMEWLYHHQATSFSEMTNLPRELRHSLEHHFHLSTFHPRHIALSSDGTQKFLFELHDGHCIESVLIPEKKHYTLCLSTQVGCAMRCTFCLSGKEGLIRHLTTSEITNQLCAIKQERTSKNLPLNLVFMGMGEPLHNFDHTLKALKILTSPYGFNLSHRRITISTAGLVPNIIELGMQVPVNLAISLNAPTNAQRNLLMPVNKKYPLEQLLKAVSAFPLPPRKRITFEYILISEVNDSLTHARELATLLRTVRCKINLIPFNEHEGTEYKRPDPEKVNAFRHYLLSKHFTVMVRESKGSDISAACGQLRYLTTGKQAHPS